MKNIFRKSLVTAIILGILLTSLAPQPSFAQSQPPPNPRQLVDDIPACGWTDWMSMGCLIKSFSYIVYYIFQFVGWFVGIAGNIMNFALGVTINNRYYTGASIQPISNGWQFSRDIVNIFFIFFLLLIAIATILGIESYGAKSLLARLIIIALLVNFSLLATQAVIFVTNALAYELYQAASIQGTNTLLLNGQEGFRRDVTSALMAGLLQQKLFAPGNPDLNVRGGPTALGNSKDAFDIAIGVLIRLLIGIFILIFAAFIFIAGAFFLIVRMVVLWLLMVLAPFGFVFLILPATRSYAQKWWTTLQSQAIFAPAFMFFLLLTIKMSQGNLLDIGDDLRNSTESMTTTQLIFLMLIQNMVIFFMLGASLVVAKSLGIYGADGAMKMAQKGGAWARGYVGRIGKRTATTATAPIAERLAAGQGRVARALRFIPGVARGASSVAALGRKNVDDYQKEIEKFNTRELKNMIGGPRIRPVQSAAIMQELVKRGDVSLEGSLTEGKLRGTHSEMQRAGINTRDLERLWPGLAVTEQQAGDVQRRSPIERMEQMNIEGTPENRIREAARRMRPADIEKLDVSVARQPYSMEAIAASASAGINQKFVERGGEHFDGLETAYRRMATAFAASRGRIITEAEVAYEDVAEALEHVGNRAGANFMRRGQGRLAFGFQQTPVIVGPPRPPRETPTGGGNAPQGNTPAQRRWIGDEYE